MNLLLPLVMPCAPGFSSLCWLEAKRIKFTFNEVLIQRMPRRFKSPCAAQTELGQEKLLVATASATGDDEVPPSFLRRFTGLNACPGDLVPSKALRSDRFRQRLKLSG